MDISPTAVKAAQAFYAAQVDAPSNVSLYVPRHISRALTNRTFLSTASPPISSLSPFPPPPNFRSPTTSPSFAPSHLHGESDGASGTVRSCDLEECSSCFASLSVRPLPFVLTPFPADDTLPPLADGEREGGPPYSVSEEGADKVLLHAFEFVSSLPRSRRLTLTSPSHPLLVQLSPLPTSHRFRLYSKIYSKVPGKSSSRGEGRERMLVYRRKE
jgi:hypothetical protein